jgi:cytochrome c551
MSIESKAVFPAFIAGLFVVGASFGMGALIAPKTDGSFASQSAASRAQAAQVPDNVLAGQIVEGQQYFKKTCVTCHGPDGVGAFGPNLHDEDMTDDEIISTIENGDSPMPPFEKKYNSAQIKTLVAYIRSLN